MRIKNYMRDKNLLKRFLLVIIALFILGGSIQCLVTVRAGVEPASVFNYGLSKTLGISFGTAQLLTNLFLFLTAFCFDKKQFGLGTIAGMIMVGYSADFFGYLFHRFCPGIYEVTGLLRIIILIGSVLSLCVAAATYMNCGLGVSPLDAWPFIISKWLPKVPFKAIRIAYDATFAFVGFLLGEKIGLVTIGTLFLMGPMIMFVGKHLKKFFPPIDPS